MTELETDYLIVGSGAMGMAFATLLANKSRHEVVDRINLELRPFRASASTFFIFGVASRELSRLKR